MKTIIMQYRPFPFYALFVAERDGKVVVLVSIAGIYGFVYPELLYRITGLIVDSHHRKQGVGKKLMLHAEQFAKDHHGKVMDLTSGLRRAKDGSHDFYKSLGYKNHGYFEKLYLRKEL